MLVSAAPNVRYLSGFTGDNGLLLVTPDALFANAVHRSAFHHPGGRRMTCEVKTVTKTPLDQAALQAIRQAPDQARRI